MDTLKIQPTINSMEVSLNAETGKFFFAGRSYPENSNFFFKPIIEWIEQYALAPAAKTECSFTIEYFNSASRKCIVNIFRILDSLHKKGHSIIIIWNFESDDETIKEIGEEYQNLFRFDFQFNSY
ncbi:MAG: DUF1987 domain-containing protein [Bacteroidota bacterium]